MSPRAAVMLGSLRLANPVIPASGTYGPELVPFAHPKKLGAIVTRSITLHPNPGAPSPRIVETAAGILSATGLENGGIETFLKDELPFWRQFNQPLILNVAGDSGEALLELGRRIRDTTGIHAIELNLSALEKEESAASTPETVRILVGAMKRIVAIPIIVKLSPWSDCVAVAKGAEAGGADAVSLVGGFPGISFDRKSTLRLGNRAGRLSGPAIKPLALFHVEQVCRAVSLPVIGMGGITSPQDAWEFLSAGAKAVAVGTASFVNPRALVEIAAGIERRQNEF